MSSNHTISLNGRRYDALTGRLLDDSEDNQSPRIPSSMKLHSVKQSNHHKAVDGFITNTLTKKSHNQHLDHKIAPHINRLTQHSKTLMRDAVKKPDLTKIKSQQQVVQHHINHAVERGVTASIPARQTVLAHARAIRNSEFVGKVTELASPANPVVPNPNVIQTTANSAVHLKNLDYLSKVEANPEIDEIFSEASLKLTDSHQPIARKETRFYDLIADKLRMSTKLLFIITAILLVLIISGLTNFFFANNINIYLADMKTGIHGILPTYEPKGYSIHKIAYSSGKPSGTIELTYTAKNDAGGYTLAEQNSSWDSQGLVNAVVIPAVGNNFKTYQISGRSIYIYNSSAVWIDAGIFYRLSINAHLTTANITQIVNTT